jgi:transcriptional regulator with XRE-family HTH domain
MERLGYTGYSLSKALETSEAVVSNIRNGKNPPNVLLIRALLNKHEDVDADWLLSGKGGCSRPAGWGMSLLRSGIPVGWPYLPV